VLMQQYSHACKPPTVIQDTSYTWLSAYDSCTDQCGSSQLLL